MTDTAQPETAAETDALALGAEAFKVALGQAPERPRDDQGRFTSTAQEAEEAPEEGEEINAEEGEQPEAVESDEDTDEGEEAADEAQPEAVDMPASWSKEDAEIWSELPPEAKARIAEREGQRDAAVGQKFQEAANLRKAHEAEIIEARTNREKYAQAIDQVMSLVQPQEPPLSMLDINSSDYNPDEYHLQNAQFKQHERILNQLAYQRQQLTAQEKAEVEQATLAEVAQLNEATGPAFVADYPEANDPVKAEPFFGGLVQFALKAGAPAAFFQNGPVSAVEWHILADAKSWREFKAAKARVAGAPKPTPKKATPAVRPGVTTPKSAIDQARRKGNFDRLSREGSIEAGAAVFKDAFRSR